MGFERVRATGDCLTSENGPLTSTVLTAADQRFARTLWQYLRSVERARIEESHRWIVYDLGFSESTRKSLGSRFAWCAFKRLPFEQWPTHLGLANRNYAWKPVLVAEEVLAGDGVVLWFDCATLFKGPIDLAISAARADGIWYLRGQTRLHLHADARSLDAMEVPLEVRHLGECVTGALGFDASDATARRIVTEWRDYALQPKIIAPPGASLANHKYDQAVLSAVIFKAVKDGQLHLSHEEIDISSIRPVRWMSSRNKVAPSVPPWADLAVRAHYCTYKWLDLWWLRASRWSNARLGGFKRHMIEHFTVSVTDHSTQQTRSLPSPKYGYLADPFIWSNDAGVWVFVEEFCCLTNRGKLVVFELDRDLSTKRRTDINISDPCGGLDCHVSFPFVFENDGRHFMIPETSHRRTLDLYECEVWPHRWRMARRLLLDVNAADSVAVRHEGRWWILASVSRENDSRHLEIYSCDDITKDPLEPHPVNARRLDVDAPFGTGRNAGLIEPRDDGSLLRFVQHSTDYYGQGGAFRRISQLTRATFDEAPEAPQDAPRSVEELWRCHHHSVSGAYSAHDRRTRASVWDFLHLGRRSADRTGLRRTQSS